MCDRGKAMVGDKLPEPKLPEPRLPEARLPEPWLRGTLKEIPAAQRAVLHALEMAEEDLKRWCGDLTYEQIHASPFGLPPVAFHLRHIARSLDRLMTYAEGRSLTDEQVAALKAESGRKKTGLICSQNLRRPSARVRGGFGRST